MRRLTVCFLISLATCADPSGTIDDNMDLSAPPAKKDPPVASNTQEIKSGSRLRHRFVAGDDGSQVSLGLYDSKLGMECQFAEAEDGKTRCLPTTTATLRAPDLVAYYISTRNLFKDYNCSERIAWSNLCEPAARYVKFSDTCGGKTRIANAVEIGAPSVIYYKQANGTCSSASTGTYIGFADLRFYTLGTPVNAEDFAAGSIMTE